MRLTEGERAEREREKLRFSYFWLGTLNGILAPFQFTCEHKRTGGTHTQLHKRSKDTHTHSPSHTQLLLSRRGSNCRWQHFTRGVWQVRQGRIKVGRKDTPPNAAASRLQPLPNAPWGTFLVFSFSLYFFLVFSTCTKHLPSIFADTFYIILSSPLCLFWQFLVVVSVAFSPFVNPILMAYSAGQVHADWLG